MAIATTLSAEAQAESGFGDWAERHSGRIMVLPAVLIVLAFAVFPLIISAYLSVSRFALAPGGYKLSFVGLFNFRRLLTGQQQYHFLGTFGAFGFVEWAVAAIAAAALVYWFYRFLTSGTVRPMGLVGRLISAALGFGVVLLFLATIVAGGFPGSMMTTLVYVFAGVALQFGIGLGLALLCAQPIRARNWFRVVFFIPLMVTPVGIAYTFRMLADMEKGPLAPLRFFFHLGEFAWATDPWSARLVVLLGDTWQWTPFMFIVMLAAVEARPQEQIEAAKIDGAGAFQIFRHVTWPAIAPIAATVVLIRLIEAFKIVDLPNVLTNGGPGLATESMTLHAFIAWRTQDLGGSAALGYILLFVSTVTCVSFFNFGVTRARRYQ
ncbi:MAG: sugar ABC transporter permease [Bauldia sp.]|jgi:multiple sugar transport system permease protein|nr:sugar ABC transporter permease [Bauldia sp.]